MFPPKDLPFENPICDYTAAVVQWVKAFAPQVEDWMFKSQPRQT